MFKNPTSQPQQTPPFTSPLELKMRLQNRLRSGANWFYWIAALSIINSILLLTNAGITFIFGLGATQVVDFLAYGIGQELQLDAVNVVRIIGWVLNLLIVGVYALFGVFANKGKRWPFIAGMVLYGLDAVLELFIWEKPDLLSFAFHLIVLWGLLGGLRAIAELEKYEATLRQAGVLPPQPPTIQF